MPGRTTNDGTFDATFRFRRRVEGDKGDGEYGANDNSRHLSFPPETRSSRNPPPIGLFRAG
jgi:hypothetical protein